MAITMTQKAGDQIKALIAQNKLVDHVVRVAATANSDGITYALDIVDETKDNDRKFDQQGLTVVIDPRSYLHVKGAVVDYTGSGFAFNNPNDA